MGPSEGRAPTATPPHLHIRGTPSAPVSAPSTSPTRAPQSASDPASSTSSTTTSATTPPASLSFGPAPSQRSRANGYNFAPRYPSHTNERGFGIFDTFRGDSLGLTQFGAFASEDELFSQLQFFRLGARPQAAGTSPILRRTAPVCIPQQQRSAAGAQQQRHGLSAWAVTHMGQSHVGHTAHTHTHTHTALLPAWYIYNTMYLPNYNRHPITYPRHVRLVRGGAVGDPI